MDEDGSSHRTKCNFFESTGCCPNGRMCPYDHIPLIMNRCLVFHHLYPNPDLFESFLPEDHPKISNQERLNSFNAFYMDVYLEMKLFGEVEDIVVAENITPHLQGNVFVRFKEADDALAAHKALENRFYAGRVVHSTFVPTEKLSTILCKDYPNCIHGLNCCYVHMLEPSKHVLIQCFPKNLKAIPKAFQNNQKNNYLDSPNDLFHGKTHLSRKHNPNY